MSLIEKYKSEIGPALDIAFKKGGLNKDTNFFETVSKSSGGEIAG